MAIKKLARILMKSRDDEVSLPTRDDPSFDDYRPIDTQGNQFSQKFFPRRFVKTLIWYSIFTVQEEMVRSFERANDQQSLLWRVLFISVIFILFLTKIRGSHV